ncbi:hypothetical protein F2Q69_00007703 [Brassica cretica]|uniref:Uncharacterized protein n=1 Tax=Brassica cretica TaxID=69181 RepID=A0A8S9NXT5_BRACR|nr:hypothetical protein F2Q69_00007703 [Brassica cretica]
MKSPERSWCKHQPLAKAAARELDKKKTRPDRVRLPQHTSATRRKTVPDSSRLVPACDPIKEPARVRVQLEVFGFDLVLPWLRFATVSGVDVSLSSHMLVLLMVHLFWLGAERSWCKDFKHKAVRDPYIDHEPTISSLTSSRFFSYCFLFTTEPAHVCITASSQLDQPLAKAAARELDKKKTHPDCVRLPQHTSVTRCKTVPYSSRPVPSCDPIRSQLASVCN